MNSLSQFAVKSMNSTGKSEKQGLITDGQVVVGEPKGAVLLAKVTPEFVGEPEFDAVILAELSTVMS